MNNQAAGDIREDFLKSLGFPSLEVHNTFSHYDFTRPGRRVLLIGPMGSGKTEYSARVWRDASIALGKVHNVERHTEQKSIAHESDESTSQTIEEAEVNGLEELREQRCQPTQNDGNKDDNDDKSNGVANGI